MNLIPSRGLRKNCCKTEYFQRLDKTDDISIKYFAESKWIVSLPSEKCKLFHAHENTYHFLKILLQTAKGIYHFMMVNLKTLTM